MRLILSILLFAWVVLETHAQCCSGGVPMSGNIGLPAANKGTWQFSLNYDLNFLETLKAGSEVLDDRSRRRETHSLLLESGYSITDRLSVDLFLSFVRQERTINPIGLPQDFVATQGLGDAVVLIKYAIWPKITAGFGMKLPTGASDRTRDSGLPLNADLQPGSGALDQLLYLNYSTDVRFRPSMTVGSTVIHRFTGTNNSYLGSSSYRFGNETQVTASIADRIAIGRLLLDPSLNLRLRIQGRDQFNNIDFPSSGGTFLFINPGLAVVLNTKLSYQLNVALPIYAHVNDTQLSPTYRINTGFFFTLPRKSQSQFIIPNVN
ncbi:MAG: hypothetical protein AAGA85_02660 [Bacteroidota bacterium]